MPTTSCIKQIITLDSFRKGFLMVCLLVMLPMAASACRNDGNWIKFRQPDGTELTVRFCGDEHFTYYLTPTGLAMVEGTNGYLRRLSPNELELQMANARQNTEVTDIDISGHFSHTWDPTKVYKSAVILLQFSDEPFTIADNPKAFYDSLFNYPGFNKGEGKGCVADYFREQSGGLFNSQYDIYGPVYMPDTAACKGNNTYRTVLRNTLIKAIDSLGLDPNLYDWNGDNKMEHLIFIYSGYGGNDGYATKKGIINPHTTSFSAYTHNGISISRYTCSAEKWGYNNQSCGIGTILHEYSHALGLPDQYPTKGDEYSVLDEWDLMDGGNFTGFGWCPPNYSPMEKMLMGWMEPVELTEPVTITNLQCVADGGPTYLIKHTDNEFYLLENRQRKGWDAGIPGQGLVIFHTYYDEKAWNIGENGGSNAVNNIPTKHYYDLFHADNLDYMASRNWAKATYRRNYLTTATRMNSFILSGTSYPLVTDTLENRELTATSTPAAIVYEELTEGQTVMDKPIFDIQMNSEGLVSFVFIKREEPPSGISEITPALSPICSAWYALDGRKLNGKPSTRGIYIHEGKKYLIK